MKNYFFDFELLSLEQQHYRRTQIHADLKIYFKIIIYNIIK